MGGTNVSWGNVQNVESINYICGFCGNKVASEKGFNATEHIRGSNTITGRRLFIRVCPHCFNPTFFDSSMQIPTPSYGSPVEGISDNSVDLLYTEARKCMGANAFTATVLCCRKLLMNVAVSKGADEGLNFSSYVKYLSEKGYVPPGSDEWLNHIREKGNEANHTIDISRKEDAEELLNFTEMLLKFVFELPAKVKSKTGKS